jgi:hypothetical protein
VHARHGGPLHLEIRIGHAPPFGRAFTEQEVAIGRADDAHLRLNDADE